MSLPTSSSSSAPKRTYGRRAHTTAHVQGLTDSELWGSASPVKKAMFPGLFRKTKGGGSGGEQPSDGLSSSAFESSPLKKHGQKTTATATGTAASRRRGDQENRTLGHKSSFARLKTKVDNVVSSLPSSPRRPLLTKNANSKTSALQFDTAAESEAEPVREPPARQPLSSRFEEEPPSSPAIGVVAEETRRQKYTALSIPETEKFDFSDLSACLDLVLDKEDAETTAPPTTDLQTPKESTVERSLSTDEPDTSVYNDLKLEFDIDAIIGSSTPAAKPFSQPKPAPKETVTSPAIEKPAVKPTVVVDKPVAKTTIAPTFAARGSSLAHQATPPVRPPRPAETRIAPARPPPSIITESPEKEQSAKESTVSPPRLLNKAAKKTALTRPRPGDKQLQDAERHIIKVEPGSHMPAREIAIRPRKPTAVAVVAKSDKQVTPSSPAAVEHSPLVAQPVPVRANDPAAFSSPLKRPSAPKPVSPPRSAPTSATMATPTESRPKSPIPVVAVSPLSEQPATLRRSNSFVETPKAGESKEPFAKEAVAPIAIIRPIPAAGSRRDSIPLLSSPLREVTNSWDLEVREEKKERENAKENELLRARREEEMKREIEDARIREQEEAELKELLNFCTIPTIEDFSLFIEEHRRTWSMQKLGEASYSEVYAALHARTKQSTVLKIMPFGRKDMEQASIQDISNELKISKTMMRFDGFVDVVGAYIVKGEYPEHLLTLWDQYADLKESENERPDFYDEEQKFCIVMLQNGGTDLEHFKLKSWREAATVFWRVAKSIAKAEQAVDFEHRDLHWGNIVLDRKKSEVSDMIEKLSLQDTKEVYAVNIQVTIIDYTLSRAKCGDEGVVFSNMDDPALYNGRGDYQFDIYRFMRKLFPQIDSSDESSTAASEEARTNSKQRRRSGKPTQRFDWSLYVPRTNTLWLHYLAERLIREKNLTEPRVAGSGSNTRAASRRGGKAAAESSQAEIDAYRSLDLVYKLIDPRKRRFGAGKKAGGGVVAEIGTAGDLVAWGREEGIVYE